MPGILITISVVAVALMQFWQPSFGYSHPTSYRTHDSPATYRRGQMSMEQILERREKRLLHTVRHHMRRMGIEDDLVNPQYIGKCAKRYESTELGHWLDELQKTYQQNKL